MNHKEIFLNYKGKKINIKVKDCNTFEKAKGLMFTRRKMAEALLFDFKNLTREPIHSFFVFFPFIAVWLDGEKIVDLRIIKSFIPIIKPKKPFTSLVEIPINDKYKGPIKFLCSELHLNS